MYKVQNNKHYNKISNVIITTAKMELLVNNVLYEYYEVKDEANK